MVGKRLGRLVWHELVTPSVAMARTFYGELLGWKLRTVHVSPELSYQMIEVSGTPIGSIVESPSVPAGFWMGYTAVDDVDLTTTRVQGCGGRVVSAPQTVPSLGRFALIADPAGAPLGISDGRAEDVPAGRSCFCWDELIVPSAEDVIPFYAGLLGWEAEQYTSLASTWILHSGDEQVATVSEASVAPHWLSHVMIDDLKAALQRALRLGGQLRRDEHVLPGVGRFAVIADPTGASLALFEPKNLERDLR
jgi:hypothetical protein